MKKLLLFLCCAFSAWPTVNQNGDFQIWAREILRCHFTPVWGWQLYEETRIGDGASKPYHIILQTLVTYSPTHWVTLATGYRQSFRRVPDNSTHWQPEYAPIFDIIFKARPGGWEFVDRNRVQYNISPPSPDQWLYRNRFRIITPWHWTRFCLTPFIDNEVFFREGFGFNEDRLSSGLLGIIYGNLSGQLAYMRRYQRIGNTSDWVHQNILNITVLVAY